MQLDRRVRRLGAAVIGYLGAVAFGAGFLGLVARWWDLNRQPSEGDMSLVLCLAPLGAVAGWFVIDRLGRPGWKGLLCDIGIAAVTLIAIFSAVFAILATPVAIFAPVVLLLALLSPENAAILVIGGAVLLAYARLTVVKDARPATTPPA